MRQRPFIYEYEDLLRHEDLLDAETPGDVEDLQPASICYDSRKIEPGALFICKGEGFKPEYVESAFEAGAICYMSEVRYPGGRPAIIVSDIRRAMALVSELFYGTEDMPVKLVGITGTKGKSTTLYFIKNILDEWYASLGKKPVGYISTIDTFDGVELFESHLTTPEAPDLHRHFRNATDSGLEAFVMEVSSQGLKYDRVYGVQFDVGVFLNYGVDHVGKGEHEDEEDYFSSKMRFFSHCRSVLLNMDSDRHERIAQAAASADCILTTYSAGGDPRADYFASDIEKEGEYIAFTIRNRHGENVMRLSYSIPGSFNTENAMAAALICRYLGVPASFIAAGLKDARAKGRMELFKNRRGDVVVISDYAHNILSFDRLYSSVKEEYPGWRIEGLFGCPGGKGLSRRHELPEVVSKYADFVWVTEEDPAGESAEEICDELAQNLRNYGCPCEVVVDRQAAIKKAISSAKPNTVIVMTGKGREEYMHRADGYEPIESDSALAEKYLREI